MYEIGPVITDPENVEESIGDTNELFIIGFQNEQDSQQDNDADKLGSCVPYGGCTINNK